MGKRLLAGFLVMCLLLGGCSADRGSSVSSGTEQDTYSDLNQVQATEEPTEEELIKLVDQAMYDICDLAFNDMSIVLENVFNGNIECDYSNQVIIDGISYQWTSRQYSEIVDYYSQTFTENHWIGFWLQDTWMWTVLCMPLQAVEPQQSSAR